MSKLIRLSQINGSLAEPNMQIEEKKNNEVKITVVDDGRPSEIKQDGTPMKVVPSVSTSATASIPMQLRPRVKNQVPEQLYKTLEVIGFENSTVVDSLIAKSQKELREFVNSHNSLNVMSLVGKTAILIMNDIERISQLNGQGNYKKTLLSHILNTAVQNIVKLYNLDEEDSKLLTACVGAFVDEVVDGLGKALNVLNKVVKSGCLSCF